MKPLKLYDFCLKKSINVYIYNKSNKTEKKKKRNRAKLIRNYKTSNIKREREREIYKSWYININKMNIAKHGAMIVHHAARRGGVGWGVCMCVGELQ